MRTLNLADLLGFSGSRRREFLFEIEKLEKKSHGASVSAKVLGEIHQKSAEILRELGFENSDIVAIEAFTALRNQLENDDFWLKFDGFAVLANDGIVSASRADVVKMAQENVFEAGDFVSKTKARISSRFHQKIPNYSVDKINKILFKE